MKNAYKIRLALALLIFILTILGFAGIYPAKVSDLQFAPLIQRVFIDFSVIALMLLAVVVLLTILFGRFYCSLICPFGILQEIGAFVLRIKKKNSYTLNYPAKYFISAVVFGALAGGSAVLLRYIEPYTYFGSALTLSIVGIVAFVTVLVIVFLKNRFFCTNICPVGAILGLLSKISLNKLYISDSCVSCGMCGKSCPAGCIDYKNKTIDNETCLKCLKCLEVCPKGGIKFGIKPQKFSLKRRELLVSAGALALFGLMIKAGIEIKDKIAEKFKDIILPPGAGSEERFVNKCLNCNLCVNNCPNKIIVKADKDFSAVHLDYTRGACDKNCAKCGEVCPSGAIKRLKLEDKQKTRIGMAMIKADVCMKCGLCSEACPYGAITFSKGKAPEFNASKCVGCGACKNACKSGAIEIFAVKEQSII